MVIQLCGGLVQLGSSGVQPENQTGFCRGNLVAHECLQHIGHTQTYSWMGLNNEIQIDVTLGKLELEVILSMYKYKSSSKSYTFDTKISSRSNDFLHQ